VASLDSLLREVRRCEVCAEHLPNPPRPVLAAHAEARILIVGQAPGRRAHASSTPWNDPSGDRLRDWMGIDRETFYDPRRIALVPMGFCYPGTGKGGDLPPRPECAPTWHSRLLERMPRIELTLLLSRYALAHYLPGAGKASVAETVRAWRCYLPRIPLPHPSPRNNRWLREHRWFERTLLPELRRLVRDALG
jgi:uracil-DNA glycosylase